MGKYRAYPEYRDSGVEWLGEVPGHWSLFGGKRIFGQRREQALSDDRQLAASQKHGVLPQQTLMEMNGQRVVQALKGIESFRHVEAGDFVISLRSFEGGIEYSEYAGCVSPAYTVLKPSKQVTPAYYKTLLKSVPFICALQATTDSLRDGKAIPFDQFGKIVLPTPPRAEQAQIAAFLDRETAKIDRLIGRQEQLIELLKEKRQAVISHAVTKGLDPDAPMKDSGVEWLGEIPAHWEVVRVKQLCSFITSGPRGWSDFITDEGDLFLQSGDLNNELGIDFEEAKRVQAPNGAEGVRTSLHNRDVVVCITGAKTGRVAVVNELPGKAYINQHLALLRPAPSAASSIFLGLSLSSHFGQSYFEVTQYGLKQGLSLENVAEAAVVLPPLKEQSNIEKHVISTTKRLDALIGKSLCAIKLLQERRTALISAAVTGKIDVREAV